MSEENNITVEEMGSKTWLYHEPWPIDRQSLDEIDLIFGSEFKKLSAAEHSIIFEKTFEYIWLKSYNLLPWPIDPNAPELSHELSIARIGIKPTGRAYDLIVLGHVGAQSVQRVDMLMEALKEHKDAVMVVGDNSFTDADLAKLKARAGRIGPTITIVPIEELKLSIEKTFVEEENRKYSHKVTPREQKNREKFMKRRK